MRNWLLLVLLCAPVAGAEKAAYDSTGRIIALTTEGADIEVSSSLVAVLPSSRRVPIQVRRDRSRIVRDGDNLAWSGSFELPDGGRGSFKLKAREDASGLRYSAAVAAESQLEVDAIEFVLDLPRTLFVNGGFAPEGSPEVPLSAVKPPGPVFYRGETQALRFRDASDTIAVAVSFDAPRAVSLVDRWDPQGRSFQLRVPLTRGPLARETAAEVTAALRVAGTPPAPPAKLVLDASKARYHLDGFGGNFCWSNQSPVSAYMLKNLKLAWGRTEMKLLQWDKQRDNPGPEIRADLEVMRRFHEMGVPYVISVWWLPERFYTDPYEKPRQTHFRLIDPEKWEELLDLMGSYLLYARREYGVEPDLFSFNEANIGVYVGQTPKTHAETIKRIGAYFRKLGLKTQMLLGDATGPRDTHKFALEAAADPQVLQYVGAVAFHSWGGGTPEQYAAWGDLAEWLQLPLLVSELGVDAAAYNGRAYNSYHYGLREARMTQELLLHARPQGTQFWQFTNDYGLARAGAGGAVEPTPRFWLMKHFTDLTPRKSDALTTSSDQPDVLFTAFRAAEAYGVHILNLGAAREIAIEGLPDAEWTATESTEPAQYREKPAVRPSAGTLKLKLAGRSLTTLTAHVPARVAMWHTQAR